jgi:uncharacterized protein (DUF2267 family)
MTSGVRSLDRSMNNAIDWLKMVEMELVVNRDEAYQATRSVLHALRDRLSIEEAAQLAAQLPMVLKGMFYDGWRPVGKPDRMRTKEEFFNRVSSELPPDRDPEAYTAAVLKVLDEKMPGEMNDVRNTLPRDLQDLLAIEA